MRIIHGNPSLFQHWRCTTCGYRTCCDSSRKPPCTPTDPFGHTLQRLGTGKPVLVHVVPTTPTQN